MAKYALLTFASLCVFLSLTRQAKSQKYDPEHPVVVEMVRKGVGFLSKDTGQSQDRGHDVLIGYAIYKADSIANAEHPLVKRGVSQALAIAQHMSSPRIQWDIHDMYAVPVAAMLLSAIGPDKYGDALRAIRDAMLLAQRPLGGFGYMNEGPHKASGAVDISQTQYVMLCFWSMHQVGIEIPQDSVVNCIECLARAQSQNGGWPYQWAPTLPPTLDARTPTASLTAAGLSAHLIAGDILGLNPGKFSGNDDEEGIVPSAFKRVDPDEGKKKRVAVDKEQVTNTMKRAEAWFAANPYTSKQQFHYYYVYSKERYESFLEVAKGKKEKSPAWYNEMVEQLAKDQGADGGWALSGDIIGPDLSTAFAILFLIRSTQKAIGELHDDTLVGGRELGDPNIVVKNGKILAKTEATTMDDALKILEAEKSDTPNALIPEKIILPKDPKERKEYLSRFARLMSSQNYEARRFAAKLLGRGDDIDFVPSLIYGLSDRDSTVARNSEASLRLISRQLDTAFLTKEGNITQPDRINAILQWRKWYLSIRPDYVFID